MAYVVLAVSFKIYWFKISCLLLLTFLLHFMLLLCSLALKFKNYTFRIFANVRHLDDIGALTVCHHIFTVMYNTSDDFNNMDIKVSFNAKQEIYIYKTFVYPLYIHTYMHTRTYIYIYNISVHSMCICIFMYIYTYLLTAIG
jgi:hypothetical protein